MSTPVGEKKWYFLRAVSGQEDKAKEYLEKEIVRENIQDHFGQILVPKEKVFEMRNGKKKLRERVLFSGYILLEADLKPYMVAIIKDIPGIIGFLGMARGGDPEPIAPQEVKRILGKVDELNIRGEMPEEPFIKGETVKVTAGAFNGFEGVIEEVNEAKKTLRVVVKIFGRNTPVELPYNQVEKIE